MSITPGQTIGNYRILQQIGTGGMGAVFLAEHPLIGKKVALKVIHKELAHNREVVGRFFNEARAVNKIGNEHIVEVHDFGQSPDGHYFFLMEYLEGRTLASVLAHERVLDVQRALHIAAQISDALGAAHACAIIHRDLKPDNVMLVTRLGDPDFVKLLDFGLAKMFEGGAVANLTAQGVVLGTPQYMSPEACESKRDIDHRTDIYALGILLFQMLCGQVPFDGNTMGEVLVKQVTHAPPAPRALNPHIPPSVEQIILRCLAKAPDARFPMMSALREALLDPDRYLASSPPVVPAALTPSSASARTLFVDGVGPAPNPYDAPPGRGTGPSLALKAPPPSLVPGAAEAKTAILDASAEQIRAQRRSSMVPAMQLPAQPTNQTMVIGTPPGYKDRPPRRAWPIVTLLVVIAGAAGGGIAIARMMRDDGGAATAAADAAVAAPVATAPVDAAPAQAAPVVEPLHVTVRIESDPEGAEVLVDDAPRGKTPLDLQMTPDGAERRLVLRHPGYVEKLKTITVTDAQTVRVELEPEPEAEPPRGEAKKAPGGKRPKRQGKPAGDDDDADLMKPPWMR